jgi:hypothetical protein
MEPRPLQSEQRPVAFAWLMKFLSCVDEGLHRKIICGGFKNAGIFPFYPEIVTLGLPLTCPTHLKPKRQRMKLIDIGNEVVTKDDFLKKWKEDDAIKNPMENARMKEESEEEENNNSMNLLLLFIYYCCCYVVIIIIIVRLLLVLLNYYFVC